MTADYAHGLYLDRGARGVEDETEAAWARVAAGIESGDVRVSELSAMDRMNLALARTERAVEVSPAGVAAVEALAGLLAWRAVDRAAVYDSVEYVDALYRLRDLADRLGAK